MSVWFLSLSCAMISCYNVSKLPICEEGKQSSPRGADVGSPFFPSDATFSPELWLWLGPGSRLTEGSLLVWMLDLHCTSSTCCGLFRVLLPSLGTVGSSWRIRHGAKETNTGCKRLQMAGVGSGQLFWEAALPHVSVPRFETSVWLEAPLKAVWSLREHVVYFYTAWILRGHMAHPNGMSKWMSSVLPCIQHQSSSARRAGTQIDSSGI